ncbi:hypothetical protein, partial [Olivibacter sp. XZL3]|uniref:hypothetical protein n=1 Tax=Olivibacter sp. XZL3 TaxID=1735116 RepID=UPI00197E3150
RDSKLTAFQPYLLLFLIYFSTFWTLVTFANSTTDSDLNVLETWYSFVYKIDTTTSANNAILKFAALLERINSGLSVTRATNENLSTWNTYQVQTWDNNNIRIGDCN